MAGYLQNRFNSIVEVSDILHAQRRDRHGRPAIGLQMDTGRWNETYEHHNDGFGGV